MPNSFENNFEQDNASVEKKEERLAKLEGFVRELGLEENPEMKQLEREITEVPSEQYDAWRALAQEKVETSGDYIRAQIGLLVAEAAIYLRIGYDAAFSDHLNDAIEYAQQMGLEDMAESLREIL